MEIPYRDMTSAARRVLERAQQEATARQQAETGPEHLLLALLGERESVAVQALGALALDPAAIAAAVERVLPPRATSATSPAALGEDVKLIAHFAVKEAF